MKTSFVIAVIGFYIFTVIISIFFKRNFRQNYDRSVLISGLFWLLFTCALWFVDMPEDLGSARDWDWNNQILFLIFIVLGVYAIMHFSFWLTHSFIRYNDLVKVPRFLFNIIGLLITVGVGLYVAKVLFDLNLSGLLVTSTVLSAIIGLSLQDTLTNLFAGVSLQVESPFSSDEWVNLGGYEGKVVGQTWRSLTLLTRENHRIILPNKSVAEEKIVNYSRPTARQIHSFNIDLDYSHPPYQVKEILEELLLGTPGVDIDEEVYPYIVTYAESGITYCLKFWVEDYVNVPVIQDLVLSRLWYALERNQIKIPYPISEVHLGLRSEESTNKELQKNIEYIEQKLQEQGWLSNLDVEQLQLLSESAKMVQYAKGEDLVIQNSIGSAMYVITKGSALVLISGESNREVHVADKSRGDFFGEMSLLTGDKTTATVRAKTDMEVLKIMKEPFKDILLKDERILEIFVEALEKNKSSLHDIIEKEKKNSNITEKSARSILLSKIKSYLNI